MFQTELENLHKYRSSAVYPAEVSSRAVLVVSLVVQAVLVARHGQTMRRPTEMLV